MTAEMSRPYMELQKDEVRQGIETKHQSGLLSATLASHCCVNSSGS